MFKHDGLTLRKLERDELELLLELKRESWYGTHHVTIANLADQEHWFDSLDHHPHSMRQLVLLALTGVDPVGIYKLMPIDWVNQSAEVGWDVFRECRGRGIGKKLVATGALFAFKILNLRRLTAEILETNTASLSCARQAGFSTEGRKRQAVHQEGFYVDSLVFGLLAGELLVQSPAGFALQNSGDHHGEGITAPPGEEPCPGDSTRG